ncbi:MAG TPA: hypothetical protein VFI95_13490 [Terriglobales bacterium]|nr:hypothetical protein [Terriglobales bacterium]
MATAIVNNPNSPDDCRKAYEQALRELDIVSDTRARGSSRQVPIYPRRQTAAADPATQFQHAVDSAAEALAALWKASGKNRNGRR